jgi:hypothetical protein
VAGLLDYLYSPSTYGGEGGLLSRLMPSTAMIPQSQGFPQQDQAASFNERWGALPQGSGRSFDAATFDPSTYAPSQPNNPIAVGNYQMPRMGNSDQFVPQQAMTPPNAQPTQGQIPQQGFGGFLNSFNENLQTLGNGGSLIGALTGQQPNNQTAQFLVARGIEPALAKTIVSDPGLLRSVLPQLIGVGGQTDDIKEYQFAKREDPSLTFQKFMQQKKAVSGEYSLTPQYGTDKDGNTVLLQTGKSGEAIQTKLPEGVKISSGVDKVDLGTSWGIIDKRTGNLVGTQPKDVSGKEAAEARGKAQGEAQAALPGALADAERTKASIDQLLNHEGLGSIVGPLDQYRPSWSLGESGNDALARYKQLQGQAFLQAYNLLKGGGAITDIEGKKAEAAMARLDRAQSEDTFKSALKDFRDAIESGVNKLKAKAGTTTAPAASAPTNLKAKYGLD